MSESLNKRPAILHKATQSPAVAVTVAHSTFEMPPRDVLLQLRQGLLIQLTAINRILGIDTKLVESQEQKR